MARIHGNRGEVLIDPTGGATPVAVASVDSFSISLSRARVDVTCFQDTNTQSVSGLPSYSGDISGAFDVDTTPDEIFACVFSPTPVMLKLVPDKVTPTYFFTGLANLDADLKTSAKSAVTWSGKWDAAGPWTQEATP